MSLKFTFLKKEEGKNDISSIMKIVEARAVIILYATVYTLRCAHRMVSRHLQIEEEGHATRSIHTRGSYVCVQKKRSHPSFPSV